MINPSPRTFISCSVALCLLVTTLTLALALKLPWTGLSFSPSDDNLLQVHAIHPHSPNSHWQTDTRIQALVAAGHTIPATASLLIEEPDMLPSYSQYNELMQHNRQLNNALANGQLTALTSEGETLPLHAANSRPLGSLPWLFWLQLAFGVGGALTGAIVWGARLRDKAACLYAMTGLGYLIFAPAAAIYSTRELLIPGELFRLLSIVNHFGALFFTASLAALLWTYPVRLGRLPIVASCYVIALIAWLGDILQWIDTTAWFHLSVLLIFSLSVIFSMMQWWQTRHRPDHRAALRWFLLSIYIATGLFAGVIIIPAALGIAPPASQGVMFGAFLVMYWGLALGIVRYRLFQIEQWWNAVLSWLFGGLAVILLDVILLSALRLSDLLSLTIATAVVGWLYFPVRQWLWELLSRQRKRNIENWLPETLPLLITTEEHQLRERWPEMLQRVFEPLSLEYRSGNPPPDSLADNGIGLQVESMDGTGRHLYLRFADSGQRLFTTRDVDTLKVLTHLFTLALETILAREQGARQERERIRRDIHDDIGARLLTLLHTCTPEQQPLVREALQDTKALVRLLELSATSLDNATTIWQSEARQRCEAAKVPLHWEQTTTANHTLSARQNANITRILREAVSNALRHAQPGQITIVIGEEAGELTLKVINDGNTLEESHWGEGRGRHIMRERTTELGGNIAWQSSSNECCLHLSLPIVSPA